MDYSPSPKFAGITYHEILDRLSELAIDSGPTLQDLEDVLPFLRVKARLGVKDRTRPEMQGPSAADRFREMRRKRFERLSG